MNLSLPFLLIAASNSPFKCFTMFFNDQLEMFSLARACGLAYHPLVTSGDIDKIGIASAACEDEKLREKLSKGERIDLYILPTGVPVFDYPNNVATEFRLARESRAIEMTSFRQRSALPSFGRI